MSKRESGAIHSREATTVLPKQPSEVSPQKPSGAPLGLDAATYHLFYAIRAATLENKLPTEAVVLGKMREIRPEKRALYQTERDIFQIIVTHKDLFYHKKADPLRRIPPMICLNPEGRVIQAKLDEIDEIVHPVVLHARRRMEGAPKLLVLKCYFTNPAGTMYPITMLFESDVLFLDQNLQASTWRDAFQVVGYLRCIWEQCKGEEINFQEPKPLARFPHLKFLVRFMIDHMDQNSAYSDISGAIANERVIKGLFPDAKPKTVIVGSRDPVKVFEIPSPSRPRGTQYICTRDANAQCEHIKRVEEEHAL